MKFEKIRPGMTLYDRHKYRAGNTTMRVLGEWRVCIVSVDPATRTAMATWNGNHPPRLYRERDLAKLKDWSMYDECAERVEGMIGTVAVRKKRRDPATQQTAAETSTATVTRGDESPCETKPTPYCAHAGTLGFDDCVICTPPPTPEER